MNRLLSRVGLEFSNAKKHNSFFESTIREVEEFRKHHIESMKDSKLDLSASEIVGLYQHLILSKYREDLDLALREFKLDRDATKLVKRLKSYDIEVLGMNILRKILNIYFDKIMIKAQKNKPDDRVGYRTFIRAVRMIRKGNNFAISEFPRLYQRDGFETLVEGHINFFNRNIESFTQNSNSIFKGRVIDEGYRRDLEMVDREYKKFFESSQEDFKRLLVSDFNRHFKGRDYFEFIEKEFEFVKSSFDGMINLMAQDRDVEIKDKNELRVSFNNTVRNLPQDKTHSLFNLLLWFRSNQSKLARRIPLSL